MCQLATDVWPRQHHVTRIDWCVTACREYFHGTGLQRVRDKELRRQARLHSLGESVAKQGESCFGKDSTPVSDTAQPAAAFSQSSADCNKVVLQTIEVQCQTHLSRLGVNDVHLVLVMFVERSLSKTRFDFWMSAAATILSNNSPTSMLSVSTSALWLRVVVNYCGLPLRVGTSGGFRGAIQVAGSPIVQKMYLSCRIEFTDGSHRTTVYKCDILGADIGDPLPTLADVDSYFLTLAAATADNRREVGLERLVSSSFHVVVFSLLLEYLPTSRQRVRCCQAAWRLLVVDGLLVIITPDSRRQHRNARVASDWRRDIESIGFARWRYEKLEHLHCMAFRKVVTDDDRRSAPGSPSSACPLRIPQDRDDVEPNEDASSDELSAARSAEVLDDVCCELFAVDCQ